VVDEVSEAFSGGASPLRKITLAKIYTEKGSKKEIPQSYSASSGKVRDFGMTDLGRNHFFVTLTS
jgi:hypothetical protein